jgi:hypothetical protein
VLVERMRGTHGELQPRSTSVASAFITVPFYLILFQILPFLLVPVILL